MGNEGGHASQLKNGGICGGLVRPHGKGMVRSFNARRRVKGGARQKSLASQKRKEKKAIRFDSISRSDPIIPP